MRIWPLLLLLLVSCSLLKVGNRAPSSEGSVYSLSQFEDLAVELAQKVNLFKKVWEQNPDAEFFGGTSRDYLYWLKGKLSQVKTVEEFEIVSKQLRDLPVIDVRDFIIGESDVDIVSDRQIIASAEDYGIKSIDIISPKRFVRTTESGADELAQGFIPVEKIRLKRASFHPPGDFGNGVDEVFSGKISVVFASAEDFASTRFAKLKINHPVLLALRYLRLTAMQYASLYGKAFPSKEILFEMMGENREVVKKVIADSSKNRVLKPYLENEKFAEWINGTLKKGYRSYTNPTATKLLHEEFAVDALTNSYESIEPLKPYLFSYFRDEAAIAKAFSEIGVSEAQIYRPVDDLFPNGLAYHGTTSEGSFRGILYQGIMESSNGVGGRGLYVVAEKDVKFAVEWAGDKERVVQFQVKPEAKIADISKPGPAQKLYQRLGLNKEQFCEKFGIDILKYPYASTDAYVVKNSDILGEVNGTFRQIKSLGKILDDAAKVRSYEELKNFMEMGKSNRLTKDEWKMAIGSFDNSINNQEILTKLLSEEEFISAGKLAYAFEGDEQFTMVKTIMDESMRLYKEGTRGQIIENSFFTTKNIILTNFPNKREWLIDYYKDEWRAFIVKAFQWEGDSWEQNENIQIENIIKQRFALIENGEDRLDKSKVVVEEFLQLYKEVHGDLNLSVTDHIYTNLMAALRKNYYSEDLTELSKPIAKLLEESLFVGKNNEFPERALKELAEIYNSANFQMAMEHRSYGLVIAMNKYYRKFTGDVTNDSITRTFLRLSLNEYKDDKFGINILREKIQPGYLEKVAKGTASEADAEIYLSILGNLSRKGGHYNGLEDLPNIVKKAGYSNELVAKARGMSGKSSLKKTCREFISTLFGR